MLASLATIMKEKTAIVTSLVYFALTKSPLEYFFWASLSYEPLSYEPNISVWVSF